MKPRTITLRSENSAFQHLETLRRNRNKRQKHREFVVEGVRQINHALRYNWTVRGFVYSRERPLSAWAEGILQASRAAVHFELPLRLLRKLSHKNEPSELLALLAMPEDDLSRIPLGERLLTVIADRPSSPGNLGTLIRSCDALRASGLVITGHAADLYDPETVSATTGSLFALPVIRLPSHQDLLPWFAAVTDALGGFQLIGSSATAEKTLAAHDFTPPTVLVVGNETTGLSAAYRELCHALVKIPMDGSATSLNVACAASIMLYEIDRQRRQGVIGGEPL
ncbi:MAG: rRNA methyltransferase [Deinococcota bacterium]|nr:rRNA methyltransferase [Deinococcota bacterium]